MSAAVDLTPTAALNNATTTTTTTNNNRIANSDAGPATHRTNGNDNAVPRDRTLEALCHDLRRKVDAFLALETEDAVLRSTQRQVRVAGDVIDEALRRYRCVPPSLTHSFPPL